METKQFLSYIHQFRGLAILLIVIIHCFGIFDWDQFENGWFIVNAVIGRGTLLFVFIAGFLFGYLSYKYTFPSYLSKKIKYVILPYIICSIPILVYRIVFQDIPPRVLTLFPDFSEINPVLQVFLYLVSGTHLLPYWFIPMIACFYFVSPLFNFFLKKNFIIIPTVILTIISLTFTRVVTTDIIGNLIHYIGVFWLGIVFCKYRSEIFKFTEKYPMLPLGIYLILLISSLTIKIWSEQQFFLQKIALSWLLIFKLYKNERDIPVLNALADLSFGIYFTHFYFILATKPFILKLAPDNPIYLAVYAFIYFGLIVLLSGVATKIVKIPFKQNSRMLVGS
ncbi:acyltransferase family protein [Marinigracilibium pacificum]|uniref:Acyltransferase n=1 Tax=Marinigracilibium pacificum TaxID=2729599 RepID=A0A848IS08_9BACT|nr:acyltransferase [Marinigracilibium pacificum]NMM47243.1 acyltransferase [Marinigracilibium pacificum]